MAEGREARTTNETPEGERITGLIQKLEWKASLRDKGNYTVAEALHQGIRAICAAEDNCQATQISTELFQKAASGF